MLNKYISILEKLTNKKVILKEEITSSELKSFEKYLDKIFNPIDLDIVFSKHFLDRVNDKRNGKPITLEELNQLFKDTYKEYGIDIVQKNPGFTAVLTDIETDINIPFVLSYDQKNNEIDLVSKTVMRKKDFKSSTPKLYV